MTLDHVKVIEAAGHRVEDVTLVKMLPTVYRITLKLDNGSSRDFFHESVVADDIKRFREEICSHSLAYGARALLQSIHMEVLEQAKLQQKAPGDFIVSRLLLPDATIPCRISGIWLHISCRD
ncbi:MAG: hypothetical protein ACR2NX_13945 [Chthoniobacterales bacterium]